MNKKDLIAQLAVLKDWADPKSAGRARKAALKSISTFKKAHGDKPLFSFPFGDVKGVVNADGAYVLRSKAVKNLRSLNALAKPDASDLQAISELEDLLIAYDSVGWSDNYQSTVPQGAAPTNKMIGDIRIACGLVLILGGGSVGKTPLAHALAGYGDTDYGIVRFGEPLAGYMHDLPLTAAHTAGALLQYSDVVLDSVKDVMAMATGAAMKSGLIRSSLPMFTQWSSIAADAGATLYVPLNPSSPDEDVIQLLEEAAKSNSTTMIMSTGQDSWKYLTRGGEGLVRTMGDFKTSFGPDGTLSIGGQSAMTGSSSTTITGTIDDAAISAVIRRALNSKP